MSQQINISLVSKETPKVELTTTEVGDVQAIVGDATPIVSFVATGDQGATGATGSASIDNGSITNAKLATNAVSTAKISSGAVSSSKLGTNSVTTSKIASGAVTASQLAQGTLTEALIDIFQDGAIKPDKLKPGSLVAANFANSAISTAILQDGAVTAGKLADGIIEAVKISANAVTTDKIATNAVTGNEIQNSVTLNGTVTINHLTMPGSSPALITGPTNDALHIKTNTVVNILNTSNATVASFDQSGNLAISGTVDGIDIASAVPLNTAKTGITPDQSNHINASKAKTDYISVTQAVNLDTIESNVSTNNSKVSFPGLGISSSTALAGDTTTITTGQASAISANTNKNTNVVTNLSVANSTGARVIASSDGTDATIPIATTSVSGVMSTTIFDEHTANVSKNTNVSTNLGITGDTGARVITSSDGTNATIPVATTSVSGLLSPSLFDEIDANTAKTSNIVQTTVSGNAGTANALAAAGSISSTPGTGELLHTGKIDSGTTGLFPTSNNANSIITLNKHSGNYFGQLGFSSNANLYYRNFNNAALSTNPAWSQIAFTDSDITGNAATATALTSGNKTISGELYTTGDAGIGTSSPSYRLDVNSGASNVAARFKSTDDTVVIRLEDDDSSYELKASAIGLIFVSNDGSERVRFEDSGDVGIGTTSPAYKLDVNGSARIGSSSETLTSLYLTATNTDGASAMAVQTIMQGYEARGQGTFHTDTSKSGEEWFSGINYAGSFDRWSVGYDLSGGQAEYLANAIFTVRSNGNVGIGTSSPSQKLDVVGNIAVSGTVDGIDIATDVAANTLKETNVVQTTITGNAATATALTAGNKTIDGNLDIGSNQAGHDLNLYGANLNNTPAGWVSAANLFKFTDGTKLGFGTGNQPGNVDSSIQANGNNLVISNSVGNIQIGDTVEITGNLTISGTVDGIDIATDVAANTAKTSFPGFGISSSTALAGNTTIPTQYTDANAVSAVAAADKYLKNDASDEIAGTLTLQDALFIQRADGTNTTKSKIRNNATTSNRTLTVPDATGTIALTSDIPTGVENNADVTDTANVTAAGALMDSELTDLAGVKGVTISTLQIKSAHHHFIHAGFFLAYPYSRYIPLNGSLNEQNVATSTPEYVNYTFPYDGYVKKMILRSETNMGSTNLKLYKGASGATVTTVLGDVSATVGASAAVEFDFTSVSSAYSKGDTMAIKVDPTEDPDGGQNITIELVFDLTT